MTYITSTQITPPRTFMGAVVRKTANESTADSVPENLLFDAEIFDTSNIHSTVANTDRLNIGAAALGYWAVFCSIRFAVNATGRRTVIIMLNDATNIVIERTLASPTLGTHISAYGVVNVTSPTDYVICQVEQNSGGLLDIETSGIAAPLFGCHYLGI